MVDELYDRAYQQGRARLHADLASLFGSIASELGKSFRAVHRIEWNAPWRKSQKDTGCV